MNISVPETLPIPENLKKVRDSVQNHITILEAEAERLKGIVVAEKYAVSQAVNERAALQAEVSKLREEKEKLEAIISPMKVEYQDIVVRGDKIKQETAERERFLEKLERDIEEKAKKIQSEAVKIGAERATLQAERESLNNDKEIFNKKVEKLKQAISEI